MATASKANGVDSQGDEGRVISLYDPVDGVMETPSQELSDVCLETIERLKGIILELPLTVPSNEISSILDSLRSRIEQLSVTLMTSQKDQDAEPPAHLERLLDINEYVAT